MGYKPVDADAVIDATAALLQLQIASAYRGGVRLNLKTAAKMAALVEKVRLEDDTEPAPVFRS
jgi:hypothetical protein